MVGAILQMIAANAPKIMDLAMDRNFQVMSEIGLQYVCQVAVSTETHHYLHGKRRYFRS
jgi:hypothetical protein